MPETETRSVFMIIAFPFFLRSSRNIFRLWPWKLALLLWEEMFWADFDSDLQMANKSLSAHGMIVIFTHGKGPK